jgi:hypothetical protein
MASVTSSSCSGLLLPPSFAGVRRSSRPSSSLRLRPRWGLRRPRTLACVAPPDSAEPQTVRFHSTPRIRVPEVPVFSFPCTRNEPVDRGGAPYRRWEAPSTPLFFLRCNGRAAASREAQKQWGGAQPPAARL